jgi:hypothetical protein
MIACTPSLTLTPDTTASPSAPVPSLPARQNINIIRSPLRPPATEATALPASVKLTLSQETQPEQGLKWVSPANGLLNLNPAEPLELRLTFADAPPAESGELRILLNGQALGTARSEAGIFKLTWEIVNFGDGAFTLQAEWRSTSGRTLSSSLLRGHIEKNTARGSSGFSAPVATPKPTPTATPTPRPLRTPLPTPTPSTQPTPIPTPLPTPTPCYMLKQVVIDLNNPACEEIPPEQVQ